MQVFTLKPALLSIINLFKGKLTIRKVIREVKSMKKKNKLFCYVLAPFFILFLSFFYEINSIPKTIFIREGEKLTFSPLISSSVSTLTTKNLKNGNNKLDVNLLGVVSLKTLTVNTVPSSIELTPGGQPVGVKLNTKGVLVVALSDIDSGLEKITSPATTSGIQIGDCLIQINEKIVTSSQDISNDIDKSNGKEIILVIDRNGQKLTKKVLPIKSSLDQKFKIGLWIRDSTAGIGTLTFYDSKTNKFGALGHPITDVDTGTILNVNTGNLTFSSIVSVKKGLKGNPGELRGIFVEEEAPIGSITKNTQCGIFGEGSDKLINEDYSKPLKIALRNEIQEGAAKILTTVDGGKPKPYDIVIEKLLAQDLPGPKSMIIRVTDPKLLEKTGGIVQGMSGSPIIQNNKIVGAVTHVLVNKPDTGYGIYIEWMLKDADLLSQ